MNREALTGRILVRAHRGASVTVEFDPPAELSIAGDISEAIQGALAARRGEAPAPAQPAQPAAAWAVLTAEDEVFSVLLTREDALRVAGAHRDGCYVRPLVLTDFSDVEPDDAALRQALAGGVR